MPHWSRVRDGVVLTCWPEEEGEVLDYSGKSYVLSRGSGSDGEHHRGQNTGPESEQEPEEGSGRCAWPRQVLVQKR